MNLSKPLNIILAGSILLSLITFLILFVTEYLGKTDINFAYFIIIPLLTGAFSFLLFSYLVEKFINKKIKLIYRIISAHKLTQKDVKINEDVLGKLTKDTAIWAENQKNEINELKEQAEFRREFLGNLAHELKTPVFSIQGYILTLLEGGLEDKSVNRQFLEKAMAGVDRITHVLEDLDDISRYEYDRMHLKIKKFNIVDLVKEVFKTLDSTAKDKKVKLTLTKDYGPIFVNADKGKIAQVLMNLISNSISYGNEKGKTEVRFHKIDKSSLLVEIADDGIGIENKHLSRLFERFYRIDKSRARNVGGSGLGLAICKHIVESHNQTISVRSTIGVGSTFSFTLELN